MRVRFWIDDNSCLRAKPTSEEKQKDFARVMSSFIPNHNGRFFAKEAKSAVKELVSSGFLSRYDATDLGHCSYTYCHMELQDYGCILAYNCGWDKAIEGGGSLMADLISGIKRAA